MNKIMKKVMLLIFLFLLIVAAPNAIFAQEESLSQQMKLVQGLGIFRGYEDGMLHPEYKINRAEFITLMLRILGMESVTQSEKMLFYDVPEDFWAKDNINFGTKIGLIEGYGNGYFGIDDDILTKDAVKILVSALGYSIKAEQLGGYPTGYIAAANSLGITKGITSLDDTASRNDVAIMISNSLEVYIMEQDVSKDEKYFIGEKTICDILNIKKDNGLVTATFGGNINTTQQLPQDEIIISGNKFKTDLLDTEQYLGIRVKFYYNTVDEKVLYIEPASSDDRIFVKAENIRDDSNFSTFNYYDNGKLKNLGLPASGITVLYNGEILSEADKTEDKIKPKSGSVCFNDTDSDGTYDLVIIKSYQILTVTSVIERGIYGRYSQFCDVDLISNEKDVSIVKDGKRCSVNEIKTNDVLSIARSLSGKTVSIVASSRVIEGEITEIAKDDGIIFTVDSGGSIAEFKMNYLYEQLYNGNTNFEKPEIKDRAVFYLDSDANIAASDKIAGNNGQNDESYGYLVDAALESDLNGTLSCRILKDNNSIENFSAKRGEKVKFGRMVSGVYTITKESGSEILGALYNSRGKVGRQMIKYKTDADGNLEALYLAGTPSSNSEFVKNCEKSSRQYVERVFEKQYYVDQKTKVFEIANQGLSEAVLSSGEALNFFSTGAYTVELYDVENLHIGAIAYYTSVTNYSLGTKGRSAIINKTNSPVMLIERVRVVNDENGENTVVEGFENGIKVQRLVANALSAKSDAMSRLKPGMLIQYETNSWELSKALTSEDAETIMVFRVLHDCNNINQDYYETWDYSTLVATNASINIIYGEVDDASLPMISLYTNNAESAGTRELINVTEDTEVLRYSVSSKEIVPVTRMEIADGMRLAVRRRNGNVRDIIIIGE